MRRVKLGQTEQGSFVVTLLSPVPPLLQPPLDPEWPGIDDEPLERLVTRRLVEALEASRRATELALSGDTTAFESAVSHGVSANLCEAVSSLIEQSKGVDVSLTWARTRPTPEPRARIVFSANDAEILKEAARTFRLRQPQEGMRLFGYISKLKRDQDEAKGNVTLKAMIEDRLQAVNVQLESPAYDRAVESHKARRPVILTGDLKRVGQRWQMVDAALDEVPHEDFPDNEDGKGA